MPEYRVQRGTFRRPDGSRAEPGDVVELPEEQRAAYAPEQFTRVSDGDAKATDDSTDEPETLDDPPEASTDIPDDWDLLRSMAIVVADEHDEDINGQSARDEIEAVLEDYTPEERSQIRNRAESRLED